MSEKDYRVIKLEKSNYVIWKWQFLNVLRAKNLISAIEEGNANANATIDAQALAILGSSLSEENMLKISNFNTFKDAWKSLGMCFENKTAYEPQALYRRLNSFKILTAGDLSQGISEIRGIVAQLKNLGETVSEHCLIGAILSSLPTSFDIFVTVWKNSADKDVESLVSKLMAEASDQAIKQDEETKALISKRGKSKKANPNNDKEVERNTCRYCKEEGHWLKDCTKLKRPYDPNYRKKKPEEKKEEGTEKLAFVTQNSSKLFPQNIWVADSGCTNHMTPFQHLFSRLTYANYGEIHLADDSVKIKAMGKGEIETKYGRLQNVLFVPELTQNLFSISAAASAGLTHVGKQNEIIFFHKEKELFKACLKNQLYLIEFNQEPRQANSASLEEWHARFNHVSMNTIKMIKNNNAVNGLNIKSQNKEKCLECELNKCTRTDHPHRTTVKAKRSGNVLHIDTAGPSNVTSLGGSKYFILCKDEASSYRLVAFTDCKRTIAHKVKQFVSKTLLETGNNVLKLVTDNGTEFVNKEISDFCIQQTPAIIHEKSVPYVPAQNGYIERDIRTIKEMAKSILSKSKLEKNLWAEAINCAAYTLNRTINSSNNSKTPYELWFGVKPNVNNLRIFGELAVLKKPDHKVLGSWDERGETAIFIGYTDRYNTYKFLQNEKVLTACDVTFINKLFNGEKQNKDEGFWFNNDADMLEPNVPNIEENVNNDPGNLDDYDDSQDLNATISETFEDADDAGPSVSNAESGLPNAGPRHLSSIPLSNSASSLIENVVQPQRPRQIPVEFNTTNDYEFTITQGTKSEKFKLSDLEWRPNANNWINRKTGHFIRKDNIQDIQARVRRRERATISRACLTSKVVNLPDTYEDAINSEYSKQWRQAMQEELNSLIENNVFEEIKPEQCNKKPVSSKWVLTIKYKQNGEIEKFKARIVARGFSQIYGIDYTETYCSVVQILTTRLLLSYAAVKNLKIKQFDVKTAFLYGDLNEEIFMNAPEGLEKGIWRLKRSLYGLKQSPRMWNTKFSNYILNQGFKVDYCDQSLFYKFEPLIIIIVYVDDGLVFAENENDAKNVITNLQKEFKIRELEVTTYRGLEIERKENGIFVHQKNFVEKILHKFNMVDCKAVISPLVSNETTDQNQKLNESVPFREAIGSLSYLADVTRPDISFVVNSLARKTNNPTENDWKQCKRVFRYLQGTRKYGILFPYKKYNEKLIGYSDSDFAGHTSGKSTTGYIIMFNNAVFHWKTQLQRHVTLSSTEAEVIALCSLAKELAWIRRMLVNLRITTEEATIKCDNQSALIIVKSDRATTRTRHLRAQDAYIREQIEHKELIIEHVKTEQQLADFLTKSPTISKFIINRDTVLYEPC